MLFKNSLRDNLALIWSIWTLSTTQGLSIIINGRFSGYMNMVMISLYTIMLYWILLDR